MTLMGFLFPAGTELTFFLAAGMVPCFGFTVGIVLLMHHFSLHKVKGIASYRSVLPVRRLRVHKQLEGDTTRTLTQTAWKGIPYLMATEPATKLRELAKMLGAAFAQGWPRIHWLMVSNCTVHHLSLGSYAFFSFLSPFHPPLFEW